MTKKQIAQLKKEFKEKFVDDRWFYNWKGLEVCEDCGQMEEPSPKEIWEWFEEILKNNY